MKIVSYNHANGPGRESHLTEPSADGLTSQLLNTNPVPYGELGKKTPNLTADPKSISPGKLTLLLLLESEATSLPLVEASGLPTAEEDVLSESEQQTIAVPDLSPLRDRWLNDVLFMSAKIHLPDEASTHFCGRIPGCCRKSRQKRFLCLSPSTSP